MDILVLNKNYESIKTLSEYHSLIWTIRYTEHGDFELYTLLSDDILSYLKEGYYLYLKDSDRLMIIEDIELINNPVDGTFLIITGRSLGSMLDRRIIWKDTILTGSLQDGIARLLDENIINPTIPERKIPNFIYEASDDPSVLEKTVDAQYLGEELYEVISELCTEEKIGFKITLTENNEFKFKLFSGEDRSYNQLVNPYVIFSPDFENLNSSTYLESYKNYKNLVLVEGVSTPIEIEGGAGDGLSRREIYASSSGTPASQASETLKDHRVIKLLEGNADFTKTFKYGEDFNIGDIVQIKNEQGVDSVMRVSEIIFTQDMNGYNIYPTFESDEE